MDFKLEISRDNSTFYKLDLFANPSLQYNVDFYDSLEINSVKIPFSTTLKIPLTTNNKSTNLFNYDPLTDAQSNFPKDDFFFKLTVIGASDTIIRGILNLISIEYNSDEPYIDVSLIDFVVKYINDLKDTTLSDLYNSTNSSYKPYYESDQTFSTFQTTVASGGEEGTLNTDPSFTRPIIFPHVDLCNDVSRKYNYEYRQFLEHGPSLNNTGLIPVFNVKLFLEYLGRYITDQGFETRVDSKLFALNHTEAIAKFDVEKLHLVLPCKLEAKVDTNTREFVLNQADKWSGTNEDMFTDFKRDEPDVGKNFNTKYFEGLETFGNFSADDPPADGSVSPTNFGLHLRKDSDPTSDTFGNERGYFAPHVCFDAAVTFEDGTLNKTLESIKLEIPVISDDKMVHGITPSSSTMKFNVFISIYEDGVKVKQIRLVDSSGDAIELNASDATAATGETNKTNPSSILNSSYDFFSDVDFTRKVLLDSSLRSGYKDALEWSSVPELHIPSGEEIKINGESRYGVQYSLEPVTGSGTLNIQHTSSHTDGTGADSDFRFADTSVTSNLEEFALRKLVTSTPSYANLDILIRANKPFNLYYATDKYNVKESLANTATITPFEILQIICKRFNCGIFYEFDTSANINVFRIDPLKYMRSGTQNVNPFIDDLKSAKVLIGGDKIKNLTLSNQGFGHFFDDEDKDNIIVGSTTQSINANGVSDINVDFKSGVFFKGLGGSALDNDLPQNVLNGSFSKREVGFTPNVFTSHQDIGVKFAFVDKPIYTSYLARPLAIVKKIRPSMFTETQRMYIYNLRHVFNGRLRTANTQNFSLLAEDDSGATTDYFSLYTGDEKIEFSDHATIEFDMVIPTSNLADFDFLLQDLTATMITPDTIAVKSVDGEVYEDNAYLTIKGILK